MEQKGHRVVMLQPEQNPPLRARASEPPPTAGALGQGRASLLPPYLPGPSVPGCSWARRVRTAWSAGFRRDIAGMGPVAALNSPSSTAPSWGCCPRKACRLTPSAEQPSPRLRCWPSSRDVRAPAGTRQKECWVPSTPCPAPALHPGQVLSGRRPQQFCGDLSPSTH